MDWQCCPPVCAQNIPAAWWNGKPVAWTSSTSTPPKHTAELPANAGDSGLLSLNVTVAGTLELGWRRAR
jgi:hypothetical protein